MPDIHRGYWPRGGHYHTLTLKDKFTHSMCLIFVYRTDVVVYMPLKCTRSICLFKRTFMPVGPANGFLIS